MKRFLQNKKGLFALLLALSLGMGTAWAYNFSATYSGRTFYFNIIDATNRYVEITYPGPNSACPWCNYPEPTGNLTLPSTVTYNGVTYTVKAIGNNVYGGCTGLTGSLTIPSTVTTIGYSAFQGCDGFTGSLTIGNSVTSIGFCAFDGCTGFTGSLTIPNSVTTIGDEAFWGCGGFTGTLTIGTGVTSIGTSAFKNCNDFTQVKYNAVSCADVTGDDKPFEGCGGTLTIGSTVQRIPAYMFDGCSGFTGSLNIPNSVTEIGDFAFFMNGGFNGSLTLGSSLTTIGQSAFYGCPNFTGSLTIPNSVTTIGDGAFTFCMGFTGLSLGSSLTTIGDVAFALCTGFTGSLTIPNSVTTIGTGAFGGCSGFTGSLTIGNSVTTIGEQAFQALGFTGSLTIPASVTSIGMNAFKDCTGFTQVNYNATNCADVTSSDKPFEGCGGSLTIGNNVQRIPSYMFYNGGFNGTLTIGKNVISIGTNAFKDCTGFTNVYYNATNCGDVEYGARPFEHCGGHLYIGSNVARIPKSIFPYASFTGSLTIPSSVTSIGYMAFYSCYNFSGTLSLGSSLTTIGVYAFYQCEHFTGSLTIPNSVATIDTYAFAECYGFNGMLTIGDNVSAINYGAFYNCINLTSVKAKPETPPVLGADAFYGVPKTIPVYVPCASLEDYETATGWSDFTNYQCNPMVTVTAVPTEGGTVSGGGNYSSGASVTVMASPNSGYLFLNWSKDGTVVSCNPSYTFTVTGDTELEAAFMSTSYAGTIIGEATSSTMYLPSHSYYRYSLTEQIYTAAELGGIQTITSISFLNEGPTKVRTYDIYMKHTTKASFSSSTDWVAVSSSYKVYSGQVVMNSGVWSTIVLDTPFSYDGTSNLLLVVDDNTGDFTSQPHMRCRVFDATSQALRIYSDGTNYNPSSPSSYTGTLMSVKNQIMLNRSVPSYEIYATSLITAGEVSGAGQYFLGDRCILKATANAGYVFLSWTEENTVVSTDANYSFTVTRDRILTANFLADDGNLCSLTFDLHDSYGDGWNGNQLVVDYENGMSTKLVVPSSMHDATFTLPVPSGSHVELGWIEGSYAYECSFAVSYTDGEVMYVATNLDENFTYDFDMDCSGQPSELVYLGDHGKANNYYLPSHSFYNYSLSEQIYTADEIGEAGLINCIAFYNAGAEKTRTYKIYLAPTSWTTFTSPTDWINTSNATLVYDGSVTMYAGRWTPILFSTAFDYDGVSNLVLIVDDNTGDYTGSPYMSCLVYPTDACQALRVFNDDTNYDPSSPSSYTGTLQSVKNQIMLNIVPCEEPMDLMVTDITTSSANINWTSDHYSFELQYRKADPSNDFENGLGFWTTIDADGDGYNWVSSMNPYSYHNPGVDLTGTGHNASEAYVISGSYTNLHGQALYPDNYLVSPQIALGGSITFWACAQDAGWPAEHFGVAVSTTGNNNASDFTTIQEWTMTAKGTGAKANPGTTRSGNRTQGAWYEYTVDLSEYAGQMGYVAIRHFDCYDQFILNVDDITIVQPGVNSSWTTDYHAASPYALTGLMHGTQYEVRVRSNCVGGHYSDWTYTTFTTLDCEAKSLPYTCGFENENEFSCWSMVNCHNNSGISTSAGHASPHGFRFYYSYYPPQYLVSPELIGTESGVLVEFDYKNQSSAYPETFQVGYSTTDDNINSFVWEPEVTISNQQWSLYSTTFPAGTKYVAVRCNSYDQLYLYLDDFNFTVPESTTQTVTLAAGWNWWSTYIEQEGIDGLTMLEESLGENGLFIKSSDAFVQYSSQTGDWTGTLTSIDNESGYKIRVSGACTSVMSGPMAVAADHPITLSQGWNWIGYPVSTAQNITSALSGFVPTAGDVLKGQDGYTTYDGSLGWTPSNFVLNPGESYMYYSNATTNKTLVFNLSKGSAAQSPKEECYWKTDRHAYPDNLNVMAVVAVDGVEQRDEALELGAFVNGECRGSAKLYYVATIDRYIAFLTVTGQDDEQVEFRLIDESEATSTSSDRITFGSNAIVGTLDHPFAVHFGAMNDQAELQTSVSVYPNPVDRNAPFTLAIPEEETVAEVLVVNAMGEVVTKETGNVARSTIEGLPTVGVYMVKVTCKSGNVYIGRVVVK